MLEEIAPQLEELWENGACRLTTEEIKRIAAYLHRVHISRSRIRDTLKLFEAIAQKHPATLKKIAELPEPQGLIPARLSEIETTTV